MIMILDNGFAASFKDGVWVDKVLFNGYELDEDFSCVEDAFEAQSIIDEARKALEVNRPAANS